jgi:hypothetical protein
VARALAPHDRGGERRRDTNPVIDEIFAERRDGLRARATERNVMTLPPDLPRSFDHEAALAHYDQAIARLEQRFGTSHPSLPGLLHSAAEELCGLGDYLAAITRAERAVALLALGGDPQALEAARVTLARAYGGVNF